MKLNFFFCKNCGRLDHIHNDCPFHNIQEQVHFLSETTTQILKPHSSSLDEWLTIQFPRKNKTAVTYKKYQEKVLSSFFSLPPKIISFRTTSSFNAIKYTNTNYRTTNGLTNQYNNSIDKNSHSKFLTLNNQFSSLSSDFISPTGTSL